MADVPLDLVARVESHRPRRPGAHPDHPRPGRDRGHPRAGSASIRVAPADPPVHAAVLEAIAAADVVSLGPGSWYTSVLPHLLVPRLRAALAATAARVVVVLNLEPQPGETDGFSPEEHLQVLQAHLGGVALHTVIADADSVVDRHGLLAAVRRCGAELVLAPVADADGAPRHDPVRLSRAALAAVGRGALSTRCNTAGEGTPHMAMTAMVKDELSRVECTRTSERKAEVTALLRFSGGLHIVGGRVVIEAELDTGSVARRLRRDISEVYGYTSGVSVLAGGNIRRGVRYLVRIAKHGEGLARQTGLVDQRGRPVRGLPPSVVSGGIGDAEAAWRGAFLAHGSLTEPGRSSSLEVTCPGPEAAMALVGAARRLGIAAKAREVRGADRVVVRDGDAISALLTRMGAHDAVLAWEERRMRREVRATANRLANFDDANLRRSARAAVAASARVERALEILGNDAPEHLLVAGRLRLEFGQASLEELGQRADPPMTKDAVAGRIRRLLAMADKRAKDLGIPDTESVVTDDMLAQ